MNDRSLSRIIAVQQWYYHEARLLDSRRFDLWLQLMDQRVHYRMPSRAYLQQGDAADFSTWSVEREIDVAGSLPLIDDDLDGLRQRVGRLQTGMAWAETPPSITRRLVTNVEILDEDPQGRLSVTSAILLSKVRSGERVIFTAERRDQLIPSDNGFRLLDRYVILDDVVLASGNLSVLF